MVARFLTGNRIINFRINGTDLDWHQSLKSFFINVSYHILVASLTLMALLKQLFINVSYHILVANLTLLALLKQLFINVSYHILVASLTLMALLLSYPTLIASLTE